MTKFILNDIFMFPATFELIDDTERSLSVSSPPKNVAYIFCLVVFLRHKAGPSGEQNTKTKIQIFLDFRFRILYRLDCSE